MSQQQYNKSGIPFLNPSNYSIWHVKIKHLIIRDGDWSVISEPIPAKPTEEWQKHDQWPASTIILSVESGPTKFIKNFVHAADMWRRLEELYGQPTQSTIFGIKRRIFQMKFTSGTMREHLDKILSLVADLESAGDDLREKDLVCAIASSLPDSYDSFLSGIAGRGVQLLSADELCKLLNEEFDRCHEREEFNAANNDQDNSALWVGSNRRGGSGSKGGIINGHHKGSGRNEGNKGSKSIPSGISKGGTTSEGGKSSSKGKESRSCYICGIVGHLAANCRKRIQITSGESASLVVAEVPSPKVEPHQVCSMLVREIVPAVNREVWCVDSGATKHMTIDREFFSSMRKHQEPVWVADGRKVDALGIGNGYIGCRVSSGEMRVIELKDVLYVPHLSENLFSVKRADLNGMAVHFQNQKAVVSDPTKNGADSIMIEGKSDGSLYRFRGARRAEMAKVCSVMSDIDTWHRRLGHRDRAAIKRLVGTGIATGIELNSNTSNEELCECCVRGKMTRKSFPLSMSRTCKPLELLHSDLCGPMNVISFGGNRYVLTIIDDYSRYTITRFLKSKDLVVGTIKEVVKSLTTKFERKPKAFRSDNGTEYVNSELQDFFATEGIEHQTTVAYTPEQNGVAERKNRSLVEMSNCLLIDSGLPKRFWAEAITWATYLQNRLPSRSIVKTPWELFEGKRPDLSHIKMFGSKIFTYVPKQKRSKFDEHGEEGTLIGYSETTKGYRVLDVKTGRVRTSCSVKIFEGEMNAHHGNAGNQPSEGAGPETQWMPLQHVHEHQVQQFKSRPINRQETQSTIEEELPQTPEGGREIEQVDEVNMLTPQSTKRQRGRPRKEPRVEPAEVVASNQIQIPAEPVVEAPRRSERINKGIPREKMCLQVDTGPTPEPSNWEEVLLLPKREKVKWVTAAKEEMNSLRKHEVWELCDLPPGKRAISCKWVFKAKTNAEGQIHTYKARLVARGFSQKFGTEYDETFAPVVKHSTIRVLLAVAAAKGLHVRQLDVKNAYLNGMLDEELYMEQPPGFEQNQAEDKVWRLKKSLYGLKQSARQWNHRATEVLAKFNFKPSLADQCLFVRQEKDGQKTYALLYVDDLLIAGSSKKVTGLVSQQLNSEFEIKDLGDVSHYLGIKVEREGDGSFLLSQETKIVNMLETHELLEPKPVDTPMETGFLTADWTSSQKLPNNIKYRQAIGALLYLATVSRPDIAIAVGLLARRVEEPTESDWKAVKRVMRFLAFTKNRKLRLSANSDIKLSCFVDADFAGDKRDRKSTSGFILQLGKSTVSWCSHKQATVAMSSTESEYVAASHAAREIQWMRQLLLDMNEPQKEPTLMREDNQACIKLIESDHSSARTKHIDVCHHQIRGLREANVIAVRYCPSADNVADVFTKPLPREAFGKCCKAIGMI